MSTRLIPYGICESMIASDAGICPNCGTSDPWFTKARKMKLGRIVGSVMMLIGTIAAIVVAIGISQQGFLNYFLKLK